MKPLQGKGCFIWQIPSCEKGDPQVIADLAQEARLTHILIKIADSTHSYNIYEGVDLVPPLLRKLREYELQIWGWHYVRGDDPMNEADKAIERVKTLQLDGYVIDAERHYKESGKSSAAKKFMDRLREGLPKVPVALSSYRYPSYHHRLPWGEFLEKCDYVMPQIYWMYGNNAGEQLKRSLREFQSMTPYRPLIPTGAAFKEHGWKPDPAEILDFLETAQELNLPGVNFYSWDSCRVNLPEIWEVIQDYDWFQPPADDISYRYIEALNTHDPNHVIKLYNPNAVHISSARIVQGRKAIRTWYQTLLFSLLPNAEFVLTNYSGTGISRHLSWTAISDLGSVHDGNDTFGIYKGKITYHYSFFTITQEATV